MSLRMSNTDGERERQSSLDHLELLFPANPVNRSSRNLDSRLNRKEQAHPSSPMLLKTAPENPAVQRSSYARPFTTSPSRATVMILSGEETSEGWRRSHSSPAWKVTPHRCLVA